MVKRVAALPIDISDIYVDESSQNGHRYLSIGALVVPTLDVPDFERALIEARGRDLPAGELAWGKVSNAKLDAYKRVVNVFFEAKHRAHRTEFHCLYADTTLFRHVVFNQGSREVGFNKEVFQIVRKCAKLHTNRLFHLYLDNRTTTSEPDELRFILNRKLANERDSRDWPFRRAHFRESSSCHCIQLVDILLGSVAFRLNGHINAVGASKAKRELSDYIKSRAPYHDAHLGTYRTGKFTIWKRQLKETGRPVALGA